eukprot:TRINITY_DN5295_c0_g1_i1.p1 TRINITY_DN5295_c0_g1~~TRINITY_DN5295_c0_g1_i1.p1  ORF type:complete len:771 (+),score=115.84 TRINITY_DN5295_c0_g1_i1:2297-4609(+)
MQKAVPDLPDKVVLDPAMLTRMYERKEAPVLNSQKIELKGGFKRGPSVSALSADAWLWVAMRCGVFRGRYRSNLAKTSNHFVLLPCNENLSHLIRQDGASLSYSDFAIETSKYTDNCFLAGGRMEGSYASPHTAVHGYGEVSRGTHEIVENTEMTLVCKIQCTVGTLEIDAGKQLPHILNQDDALEIFKNGSRRERIQQYMQSHGLQSSLGDLGSERDMSDLLKFIPPSEFGDRYHFYLNPEFVRYVDEQFEKTSDTNEIIQSIRDHFGDVFACGVKIGVMCYLKEERKVNTKEELKTLKAEVRVAAATALAAGAASSNYQAGSNTASSFAKLSCYGGSVATDLNSLNESWQDPNDWRAIEICDAVDVIELLPTRLISKLKLTRKEAAFTVEGADGINKVDKSDASDLNGAFYEIRKKLYNSKKRYVNLRGAMIQWETRGWSYYFLGTAESSKWCAIVNGHHRYHIEHDVAMPPASGWHPRQITANENSVLKLNFCAQGTYLTEDETKRLDDLVEQALQTQAAEEAWERKTFVFTVKGAGGQNKNDGSSGLNGGFIADGKTGFKTRYVNREGAEIYWANDKQDDFSWNKLAPFGKAKWVASFGGHSRFSNGAWEGADHPPQHGWITRHDCASGDMELHWHGATLTSGDYYIRNCYFKHHFLSTERPHIFAQRVVTLKETSEPERWYVKPLWPQSEQYFLAKDGQRLCANSDHTLRMSENYEDWEKWTLTHIEGDKYYVTSFHSRQLKDDTGVLTTTDKRDLWEQWIISKQ